MNYFLLKLLVCCSLFSFWPGVTFNGESFVTAAHMIDQPIQTASLPKGTWGGQGINLEATDEGAAIEFDCAHGAIATKISPDREGKFEVKGVYVREGFGPTRQGRTPAEQPAVYAGITDVKTMTLSIRMAGSDEVIATYELTHGRSGRVRKCK